ncbi:SDR family NAD(P)-dependent oxidoreductase [Ginsengibacter hankyongi]|uniref:SDR family NAD(P)-dependent oxidoreductase n=1 Tax=Ginsengibacter hankyongi TaxID=2607284 RepID=A0A5J5IHR5_9BACT|nr:SDR family NAD(P)-dependent oxidoreductase [Ginsengibacter hankyongi]KAA9040529.1 SDR family NAD(P)-dependent oxidoreductase [Ginsengibacter hankyongi]
MDIEGKIAVITGASSGLGASLADALITKGATVYGLARNIDKLRGIENRLRKNFIPVSIDITNQKDISSWVQDTFSNSHIPDMLINNAGAGYFTKIDELSLERWHEMINTNLNGAFYITSSIVPFMKKNTNTYHIINIGSILGKTTRAESAAYSATKYGMQGFSEALFKELRSYKIKVTCVNPGSIDTAFFEDSGIKPHKNMLQPKDIAQLLIHILETPDNFLVDEITVRPLIPNPPA